MIATIGPKYIPFDVVRIFLCTPQAPGLAQCSVPVEVTGSWKRSTGQVDKQGDNDEGEYQHLSISGRDGLSISLTADRRYVRTTGSGGKSCSGRACFPILPNACLAAVGTRTFLSGLADAVPQGAKKL